MALISKQKNKKARTIKVSASQLRILNFSASGFYALQAVLILLLSSSQKAAQPITTGYLAQDKASGAAGQNDFSQAYHHLFDFNLAYLVGAFLLAAAIFHLILATTYRKSYEKDIKDRTNKARWAGYSITLSLITATAALLSGIFELTALLMIFTLTAVLSLTGLMAEKTIAKGQDTKWLPYVEGVKFGLVPWLVIFIYAWGSYAYGNGIPAYIYFVYLLLILLLGMIFANLYMQIKKMGHWEDYAFGEKIATIGSFLITSAIAWLIFAYALR